MSALLPSPPQEISGSWYIALHTAECLPVEPHLHGIGELVRRSGHVPIGSEIEGVKLQIDRPVMEAGKAEARCRMLGLLRGDQFRKPAREQIRTNEQIDDAVSSPGRVTKDGLCDDGRAR